MSLHSRNVCLTEAHVGSIVSGNMFNSTLESAILETLAYSDIFEYPLHLNELYRYLPLCTDVEQLLPVLNSLDGLLGKKDDFYFLAGREKIVEIRKQREAHSQKLLHQALTYGWMLGSLPFIRMVALTGSLAVMNSTKDADFDYMLVTAPNRVWTARAFALLLNRVTRSFGHRLCPNLIVSENALAWSTHDLYSARELCQMKPITGIGTYRILMKENEWIKDFLPNAFMESGSLPPKFQKLASGFQKLFELPLRSKLGDQFESWEMNRKIVRFSKQAGFGEETVFNADVCQGNFDHHKKWTQKAFDEKLQQYVVANPAMTGK
jgi:hypothetical protein